MSHTLLHAHDMHMANAPMLAKAWWTTLYRVVILRPATPEGIHLACSTSLLHD